MKKNETLIELGNAEVYDFIKNLLVTDQVSLDNIIRKMADLVLYSASFLQVIYMVEEEISDNEIVSYLKITKDNDGIKFISGFLAFLLDSLMKKGVLNEIKKEKIN